jgi:hypothetical protein
LLVWISAADCAWVLIGGKAVVMSQASLPDRQDLVQWQLVDDELLVLDGAQGTVYRFSGDEPARLRLAARDVIVNDSDHLSCGPDEDGPDGLSGLVDLGVNHNSGRLSRRAMLKTAAAAGIAIGFSTLRLPAAAAQASGDPAPMALAAITGATSAEVIGSP